VAGRRLVAVRPTVARIAAPVAFLVAVTVAVLLIRPALRDAAGAAPRTTLRPPVHRSAAPPAPRPARRAADANREFYEIRAGDTLGSVASRYETTVETLGELNPGIDPTGLQVGQRIRVK
jgi:Tfp pilus assembly protein FimV